MPVKKIRRLYRSIGRAGQYPFLSMVFINMYLPVSSVNKNVTKKTANISAF
ncbi:hypothetical protein HMPREF0080_00373 [Anaeroglobus geminatus F0357]|uniref:Uncharacterized protein n=1 Tax=Anaeroglobus geminatus F0357 TaxID=861450 RepID=G9YFG1_9FIRM|nr:hypothetical protein HMPREF0080_00373 [Anaeroglobus geminatus F0357]